MEDETHRPTQSIIHVPLQVNRFQKVILLIVQSCSRFPEILDFLFPEILFSRIWSSAQNYGLDTLDTKDLIHELQRRFPQETITHNGNSVWIAGILYVDDLCLMSTNAQKLQDTIHVCQTWSEKARMQIYADKSKIMAFPKQPSRRTLVRNQRKKKAQTYTLPHSTCCHHSPTNDQSNNSTLMTQKIP